MTCTEEVREAAARNGVREGRLQERAFGFVAIVLSVMELVSGKECTDSFHNSERSF